MTFCLLTTVVGPALWHSEDLQKDAAPVVVVVLAEGGRFPRFNG